MQWPEVEWLPHPGTCKPQAQISLQSRKARGSVCSLGFSYEPLHGGAGVGPSDHFVAASEACCGGQVYRDDKAPSSGSDQTRVPCRRLDPLAESDATVCTPLLEVKSHHVHGNLRVKPPALPLRRLMGFSAAFLAVAAAACASSGSSSAGTTATSASAALTFEQALAADSSTYEPPTAFRAVAEDDWAQAAVTGSVAGTVVEGSRWKLGDSCEVYFTSESDVLAATESAPLPTRKLGADACRGHTGFWQMSAGRVFFWMPLAGNWSVEYYGDFVDDSTMLLRRYPLRRGGPRSWRPDRDAAVVSRATRVIEKRATKASYDVTRALKAVGEADWATRPGAGTAASVAGTRWRTPAGCTLTFATTVLARAAQSQRLTRAVTSTGCDGLKGSWQQAGKRVFWLVTIDSLTAVETYADVADTLMRARHYDLKRASTREPFQGTWDPMRSHTLTRVRR